MVGLSRYISSGVFKVKFNAYFVYVQKLQIIKKIEKRPALANRKKTYFYYKYAITYRKGDSSKNPLTWMVHFTTLRLLPRP